MPMLDASLAFALTMLALASVVTLLMEIFHRALRLRAKGLRQMVERLYDQELEPWVDKHLEELGETASDAKEKFLDQLLKNPLVSSTKLLKSLRRVEKMSDEEFLQRLGETEAGKLLHQMVKDKKEEAGQLVDRWAQMFEVYGQAASDYFTRRAKLLSLIVGIALAFVANIDAVRIFNTYLEDPAVTQAIIADSDSFQQGLRQLDQALAADRQAAGQSDDLEESRPSSTKSLTACRRWVTRACPSATTDTLPPSGARIGGASWSGSPWSC